jgi:hypothetical protein
MSPEEAAGHSYDKLLKISPTVAERVIINMIFHTCRKHNYFYEFSLKKFGYYPDGPPYDMTPLDEDHGVAD